VPIELPDVNVLLALHDPMHPHHDKATKCDSHRRYAFACKAIAGPKQITDVYLLGLCQRYGGTLVTLDTGISSHAIVSPHPDLLRIL
jgi:predicted nucleic acid-binding protein